MWTAKVIKLEKWQSRSLTSALHIEPGTYLEIIAVQRQIRMVITTYDLTEPHAYRILDRFWATPSQRFFSLVINVVAEGERRNLITLEESPGLVVPVYTWMHIIALSHDMTIQDFLPEIENSLIWLSQFHERLNIQEP